MYLSHCLQSYPWGLFSLHKHYSYTYSWPLNNTEHVVLFCSVQSLSRVWLFVIPWTGAHQASLSITNFQSLPKLMSIESVMPSNHLILCHPLLLLPSIFPSIRVFSNESAIRIRWPKYHMIISWFFFFFNIKFLYILRIGLVVSNPI